MTTTKTNATKLAEELKACMEELTELGRDGETQIDLELLDIDGFPQLHVWNETDRSDEAWNVYVDYLPNADDPDPKRQFEGHIQWRDGMGCDPKSLAEEILTDLYLQADLDFDGES